MDSPVCTFTGDGEGGTLITASEGEVCATEGGVDGDEERDAGTGAPVPSTCRDDDNDTDDNVVEVSLLDGM